MFSKKYRPPRDHSTAVDGQVGGAIDVSAHIDKLAAVPVPVIYREFGHAASASLVAHVAKSITPHCSPAGLSPRGGSDQDGSTVRAAHGRPALAWIFRAVIPVRLSDSAE